MLIDALCMYYDILNKAGSLVSEGFSKQNVHYKILLTEQGEIADIISCMQSEAVYDKKGKAKQVSNPLPVVLPHRTQKTAIDANFVEHRPVYIFGMELVEQGKEKRLSADTNKAKKSHAALVEDIKRLEGIDSPIVNAYRAFLLSWQPEQQFNNEHLLKNIKDLMSSSFIFALSGRPDIMLHEDEALLKRWESLQASSVSDNALAQCAIYGEKMEIARLHDKIKGVVGGNSTGMVLVGYNNPSDESYCKSQSNNSNISKQAMQEYTAALNWLLDKDNGHKTVIGDTTVIHFAMSNNAKADLLAACCLGFSDEGTVDDEDKLLKDIMADMRSGSLEEERIAQLLSIGSDTEYYIVGLKPNSARIAVKFIYRSTVGQILKNALRHRLDMQLSEEQKPVSLYLLLREFASPHDSKKEINPALMDRLLAAIVNGTPYPDAVLSSLIGRIKSDSYIDKLKDNNTEINYDSVNYRRVGLIKAYLNRKQRSANKKEEISMALDRDNTNQAYLCGRLFAVLERIQQQSAYEDGIELNRTVKHAYFGAAAARPAGILPSLIQLSQHHLRKLATGSQIHYDTLLRELHSKLEGGYPSYLSLVEQGNFMVGYYQQKEELWPKKDTKAAE